MGHHHHHHHHHHSQNDEQSVKRIKLAFILNLLFTIIELIGGILTQSMAIIADAVHDFGDSFSLGLALFLQKKSQLKANDFYTYGYQRLSVASALITGVVLLVGSSLVLWESVPRLFEPVKNTPNPIGMLLLATFGIIVNGFAAWKLSSGHSQNEKVLSLHLLEDLLGWIAVFIGAIIIHFYQWYWIDPLLAVLITSYILWNVIKSLVGTIKIFLQYIPEDVDLDETITEVKDIQGVESLVDFHAWSLDGSSHVFTCSITVTVSHESYNELKKSIKELLRNRGFTHVTVDIVESDTDGCH
mgnify:CR=1 FL=1